MEIPVNHISQYVTERAKIPRKIAMIIEAKTGISAQFIMTGDGADLVPDVTLTPLRPIGNVLPPIVRAEPKPAKEPRAMRGDCKLIKINRVGRLAVASDVGMMNIVNSAPDGLKAPAIVNIIDEKFCGKYGAHIGVDFVIDYKNYKDKNVVLAQHDDEFYLAFYHKGNLTDMAQNGLEIAQGEHTEILGSVYVKIEKVK